MAKIHKVELYLLDVNEDFDSVYDIMVYMTNMKYAPYIYVVSSESKEFEWNDDVVINRYDCSTEQYNSFFEEI
ncbi:MAG: hypothetical protein IKW51_08525 [Bacteroidales bacterium]|nr:hypothetical protein [Bacteroidales bacterium]